MFKIFGKNILKLIKITDVQLTNIPFCGINISCPSRLFGIFMFFLYFNKMI